MPIWCPKDAYIKFKVKGEWRIDKLYQYTTSKGLPSNNTEELEIIINLLLWMIRLL